MEIVWRPGVSIDAVKKQVVIAAIKHYKTKNKAARMLGVSERTMRNWIAEWNDAEVNAVLRPITYFNRRDESGRFLR